ncbi:MAG: crossover junction endodeoxyribonuclease RuvC [Candidatus Andersenbacteria bacterium]
MRVLGIDPGIERTGFAVVDIDGHRMVAHEYGCVTTLAGQPLPQRLTELRRDLAALIAQHKPDAAVVEQLVFVHNATSAAAVGAARGVILLVLAEAGLPISEYAPAQVKQAVAVGGAGSKGDVGRAVALIFQLPGVPQPDDAADALALTVCHASQVAVGA